MILKYSPHLQNHIARGQKSYDEDLISMKHAYLSHDQLSQKARKLQEEKRNLRLQLMSSKFKCSKLCATLSLHERFLVDISENNIPLLQQLVHIALKNNTMLRTAPS